MKFLVSSGIFGVFLRLPVIKCSSVFLGTGVHVCISGYGQTGPYAKRAGYDVIVAATGGLTHITGPEVRCTHYQRTKFWTGPN